MIIIKTTDGRELQYADEENVPIFRGFYDAGDEPCGSDLAFTVRPAEFAESGNWILVRSGHNPDIAKVESCHRRPG